MIETVIITKEDLQKIFDSIEKLHQKMNDYLKPESSRLVTSLEFNKMLGISKRTSQTWRDEGIIEFVQIGGKIFYKYSAIEKMMYNNTKIAFKYDKNWGKRKNAI